MRVLYLYLPRFPLQRRVLEAPSLAKRPLALWEEERAVRRVKFVSAAAARRGIRPGLTLTAADALCPELHAAPFLVEAERAALGSLGEALLALAPGFELDGVEGLWLDAATAGLWKGEPAFRERVLSLCGAQGYRAYAVLASQLFSARALARYAGEANGAVPESAGAALAPLPLEALEGEVGVEGLRALGLSTLGEVAALPSGAVVARFGAQGQRALRLARGEDDRLLVPAALPEVLEERVELDWPAESLEPFLFATKTVLDRLCARLVGRQQAVVRLALTLRLEPSGQVSVELALARPTAQQRLLLDLARHRFENLTLESPIGGLWARVEESCPDPGRQLALGDEPSGDAELEVVLSRLATALGPDALVSAEPLRTHRPEKAYGVRRFGLPGLASRLPGEVSDPRPGELSKPKKRREALEVVQAQGSALPGRGDCELEAVWRGRQGERGPSAPEALEEPPWLERPARLLAKACEVKPELDAQGKLVAASFWGRRRVVTAIAGPERLWGEWWGEAPYARDYYRVHFEGLGPVWLYRDARDGGLYLQGLFD